MALDLVALESNGPRIAGTPASLAAGDYLAAEFRKAGYVVEFQTFMYSRTTDLGSTLSLGSTSFDVFALQGSPSRQVEASLAVIPGQGRAEDYADLNVKDQIVVVRRGGITFLEKARQAAERGALAIIVVNTELQNVRGTFGGISPIPGVTVSGREGEALFSQVGARVALQTRIVSEDIQARNLIARRSQAKPQVIVGGHYDSVPASPGANDNSSGTVTTLELARELAGNPMSERIWFVLFDGEEDGLWGSRKFVENNQDLLRSLKAMINLDMVGVRVSQGLGVSGDSELVKLVQSAEPTTFSMGSGTGGSDHSSFASAGVAVLFFHWGIDPNYHLPGDNIAYPEVMAETGKVVKSVLEGLLK